MRFAKKNGERILPNPLVKGAVCPYCNEEVIAKCGSIKVWHWSHKSLEKCDVWNEGESEWHYNLKKLFPETHQEVIIEKCDCIKCNPLKNHNGQARLTDRESNNKYCSTCKHEHSYPCNITKHIADIQCSKGMVIELQHSPISEEQIKEREEFYNDMIWILNGKTFAKNLILKQKDKYFTFRWKWFPKSWANSKKLIYIDLESMAEEFLEKMNKVPHEEDELFRTIDYVWETKKGKGYWRKKYWEYHNKLFLIKKIYTDGKVGGWGLMVDKEKFLKNVWRDN